MSDRHKTPVAIYIILENNNKVYLMQRKNSSYMDGKYEPIAGHLEKGESIKQTAIREAKEEAGVIIKEADLELVHTSHIPEDNYLNFFFRTTSWIGTPKICEPKKCSNANWFDKSELPEETIPKIKEIFKLLKNNILYSDWKSESKTAENS